MGSAFSPEVSLGKPCPLLFGILVLICLVCLELKPPSTRFLSNPRMKETTDSLANGRFLLATGGFGVVQYSRSDGGVVVCGAIFTLQFEQCARGSKPVANKSILDSLIRLDSLLVLVFLASYGFKPRSSCFSWNHGEWEPPTALSTGSCC